MVKNDAPSYEALKNSEYFKIRVTPFIAGISETLDGDMENDPISSSVFYEGKVSGIDDRYYFPFEDLLVSIREMPTEDIQKLSGKYPLGHIRFFEDSASIMLMCRSQLVSSMVSTLAMVKLKEIEFYITLPKLPDELPSIYPVLKYQYLVRSKSHDIDD